MIRLIRYLPIRSWLRPSYMYILDIGDVFVPPIPMFLPHFPALHVTSRRQLSKNRAKNFPWSFHVHSLLGPVIAAFWITMHKNQNKSKKRNSIYSPCLPHFNLLMILSTSDMFISASAIWKVGVSVNWGRGVITYINLLVNSAHRCKTWGKLIIIINNLRYH